MNPKIIFTSSSFRIIATDEQFHVEQSNGVDMMGVTRWFSWNAGTVDRDGGEDAHEAIKIPASMFAALCRSHESRSSSQPSVAELQAQIDRHKQDLADARRSLRALCQPYGIGDWPESTYLADAIRHVAKQIGDLVRPAPGRDHIDTALASDITALIQHTVTCWRAAWAEYAGNQAAISEDAARDLISTLTRRLTEPTRQAIDLLRRAQPLLGIAGTTHELRREIDTLLASTQGPPPPPGDTPPSPSPSSVADLREALIVELTRTNRSREWSVDMVRRIQAGTLTLSGFHSEEAHKLAAALLLAAASDAANLYAGPGSPLDE
jgi:hypothetical protein